MKKQLLFLLLNLCFLQALVQAQGSIRGKVNDKETGEPLIGANVIIKQTGQGAVTDLDGNYVLRDIPAGVYDIDCTFMGYGLQRVLGVRINDDGIKLVYFRLGEGDQVTGIEVIVTAEAAQYLETSMLAKRKNSSKILETLSSEEIFRSGDEHVGDALKHLTNISVENDHNVYIRGLGSRYVKTLLNGAELPGLDLNTSSVQLDLFPSTVLDNIVVYKNYSPDLVGSFGGGYVEINTKSFPERFTLQFIANLGYHSIATFSNEYKTYEGGSLDWLGVDDGTRALPSDDVDLPAQPTLRESILAVNELTNRFPANFSAMYKPAMPNNHLSFVIGNQTNLKKGRSLSYGLVLLYKSMNSMYDDGFTGLYELDANYNTAFTLSPRLELTDRKFVQDYRNNILATLAYKTRSSKIILNLMQNRSTEKTYREQDGIAPRYGQDMRYRTISWLFDQKGVLGSQLQGKHLYNGVDNTFEWQLSTTRSFVKHPDWRYFTAGYTINPTTQAEENYVISDSLGRAPTRFYRDISAWNGDLKLDFTYDKPKNQVFKKLKWGTRGTLKTQIFDERQIKYQTAFMPFSGTVEAYIQPENYLNWNESTNSIKPGIYVENAYDSTNNYIALEAVMAAYVMTDLHLSKKLILTGGLRTELTANAFTSADSDSLELQGVNIYPVILPAVALRYEVERDMFMRFSYASTVARPTLRELSAFTSFDYIGDYTVTGNLGLARTPTILHSFDYRWEVYPSNREVVSAGAFFKYIQRPIELVSRIDAPNQDFQFQNIPFAYVFGFEVELRQGLGFLGDWGKNFVMAANLGYIYSQARIPNRELAIMQIDNPRTSKYRPLFGQSPYVINFLLNYQNDKAGVDANVSFNVSGKKIIYVLYGNTPNVYEMPRGMLSFNITKHVAEKFHFRFSVDNLLDAKLVQIQSFKGRTYSYRQHSLGRTLWLGFSYLIK